MKQQDIKTLCKQYIAGAVSDAQLLSKLQVGEDVKTLLWGVTALPRAAQLRIRIEDLQAEIESERPKTKTKVKSEKTYMQRLETFVCTYRGEDEDSNVWSNPEIKRIVFQNTPQTVFYKFSFRQTGTAFAFQEELKRLSADNGVEIKRELRSREVTVAETLLDLVNLVPPAYEVTEIF